MEKGQRCARAVPPTRVRVRRSAGPHLAGPGSYDPPNSIGKGPAFSIIGRSVAKARSRSVPSEPGPGTYDVQAGGGSPAFSMRGRRTSQTRDSGPGVPPTRKGHGDGVGGLLLGRAARSQRIAFVLFWTALQARR